MVTHGSIISTRQLSIRGNLQGNYPYCFPAISFPFFISMLTPSEVDITSPRKLSSKLCQCLSFKNYCIFLILQSVLPTRRFFNVLMDDHHLVVSFSLAFVYSFSFDTQVYDAFSERELWIKLFGKIPGNWICRLPFAFP